MRDGKRDGKRVDGKRRREKGSLGTAVQCIRCDAQMATHTQSHTLHNSPNTHTHPIDTVPECSPGFEVDPKDHR